MAKSTESVLVVPAERFRIAGAFHGFRPFSQAFRDELLAPEHLSYRPRGEVETDPSFKQLIPYVVLRCAGELFHYTRGKTGAEERLRALRRSGWAGISRRKTDSASGRLISRGMLRELNEEVEIQSPWTETPLGFIYDGRTPVGEVHIGIVHLLELENPLVWPRESAIDEAGFAPLTNLLRHRDEFETWSQFVLEELEREGAV